MVKKKPLKPGKDNHQGEGGGRPLKFKTVKILEKKINQYFKGCFEEKWFDEVHRDKNGKKKLDKNGKILYKPIKKVIQIKPVTITGLAVALKTSRQTLVNYEKDEKYFDTIKEAKSFIENCLEEGMLMGDINPAAGIFNAKNNFGWVDRIEQDHTSKGEKIKPLLDLTANGVRNNDSDKKDKGSNKED